MTTPIEMLSPLRGQSDLLDVDREKNIIRGAAILQLGDVNDDRPWFADDQTLQQVVDAGNAAKNGLKARFTHPNMSGDGLGKFLGRWKNFRRDGEFVRADAHISDRSFKTPHGDLGTYVLDMADDEPEAFGVSVSPRWDHKAMEAEQDKNGRQPLRLEKLIAADVVDEPAGTRGGFFGKPDGELSASNAPAQATQVLDTLFSGQSPEVVRGKVDQFLTRYLTNRGDDMADTATVDDLQTKLDESDAKHAQELADLRDQFTAELKEATAKATDGDSDGGDGSNSDDDLAEVKSTERKRIKELTALARNTGLPKFEDLSARWVDKDLSIMEAKCEIADLAVKHNRLVPSGDEPEADKDAARKAQLTREWHAEAEHMEMMGTTLEEYIETCLRDDSGGVLKIRRAS
ncbi:MAG: hypothetical protein O7D91_21365 [Planctomycetota bacterium]|nr:hypothetical protein [Planctomycetota bacterium]